MTVAARECVGKTSAENFQMKMHLLADFCPGYASFSFFFPLLFSVAKNVGKHAAMTLKQRGESGDGSGDDRGSTHLAKCRQA